MPQTDLPTDMTEEHFYHMKEKQRLSTQASDHQSTLHGLWDNVQGKIQNDKYGLEVKKPGLAYSNQIDQFPAKSGYRFGKVSHTSLHLPNNSRTL